MPKAVKPPRPRTRPTAKRTRTFAAELAPVPRPGRLWLESWAGRTSYRVDVIDETPKRYRVRLLEAVTLKGWAVGDVRLVPKYAVEVIGDMGLEK